ncbi:Aste57867_24889 [Aphanomyces stellatus]|uniref:Aste57867_24889 protein n=1 Tax=Aphanomyces stellatus TaxID=120398 RepID=A0A485LT29_9STRA|nr:hypothetical protein As57867_024811 [Aphanomyces stellatus]VFU01523.1 Aste57867_24889 [Aphanomyces stellatus]
MKGRNMGRWLPAEEVYADLAISCFLEGILDDCACGTTLRQYIARRLHCDEMRVTKKLRQNKTLAGGLIQRNFNRRHFARTRHVTPSDMDKVTSLKLAYLRFETELAQIKGKDVPASTSSLSSSAQRSPSNRMAIASLLNEAESRNRHA